jgi:Mrp family chromosome partitioning ATPase/capsular polysaccharide biosynthesis protein
VNETLVRYLSVLRLRWRIVLAVPLLAVTLAAVFLIITPPRYESSAVLFVSTPRDDELAYYRGDLYSKDRMASYAALIKSPDLAQRVNDHSGLGLDPATLSAAVSLTPLPGTVLLALTASGDTPNQAQAIAVAYVEELRRSVSTIESVPGSLTPRAELITVAQPTINDKPSGFPVWLLLGGAGGLGLIIGCFAAVLISLLDGRIRRPEEAAEATGVPTLAVFPSAVPWDQPPTQAWIGESARDLRTPLDRLAILGSRVILIASAEDGAGKTGTALAVARALADRGSSVAVVDFDSHGSRLAQALDITDGVTVRALAGAARTVPTEAGWRDRVRAADWNGVAIVPFGEAEVNPGATADSDALGDVFDAIRQQHEWVIIDTPGVESASDAVRLARHSDAVLMVARTGHTSFDALRRAAEELTAAGGQLAGVVFVDNVRKPSRRARRSAPVSDSLDS